MGVGSGRAIIGSMRLLLMTCYRPVLLLSVTELHSPVFMSSAAPHLISIYSQSSVQSIFLSLRTRSHHPLLPPVLEVVTHWTMIQLYCGLKCDLSCFASFAWYLLVSSIMDGNLQVIVKSSTACILPDTVDSLETMIGSRRSNKNHNIYSLHCELQ